MQKIPDTIRMVAIDCTGELTKSRWIGEFRAKAILSHADKFKLERIYAELMPENDKFVKENDKIRAAIIAELSVTIVDGPEWWSATRGGQLMADDTPLYELMGACKKMQEKWSNDLEASAKNE